MTINNILDELLSSGLPEGKVLDVRIGLHWTAVVVETQGGQYCGLAATLHGQHEHSGVPNVENAGSLAELSAYQLAEYSRLEQPVLPSIGVAAINALLPRTPELWIDANAEEIIAKEGAGKRVVMVGHFPFASRLKPKVGELIILEMQPGPGDLPASAASDVIPSAQIMAITGMTIVNHTLVHILSLCSPDAFVMLLGPSTPLSARLFDFSIDFLSGAVVMDIPNVLRVVSQGGNFRQVHQAGVRLVNITRPDQAMKKLPALDLKQPGH